MVNFYEDNTCQVVVHTANLLRIDWEDKAQAIWCSPRLPKLKMCAVEKTSMESHGDQFKHDLLAYFRAYKLPSIQSLILRLHEMDFSMVRAVFIASVPGVYAESSSNFGFCKLRHVLGTIGGLEQPTDSTIVQVSSLGSLGKAFYDEFQSILNTVAGSSVHRKMSVHSNFRLIFPTIANVRDSLCGWISGGSLFFNCTSASGIRQELLSKPHLHQWSALKAGRDRVMPHVKSYARISQDGLDIRWILFTSANLSKAAWGGREKNGIRIKSYEAGVLLHPGLFQGRLLKPSYKTDFEHQHTGAINVRMPYDLQVSRYGLHDKAWSLQRSSELLGIDWLGRHIQDVFAP